MTLLEILIIIFAIAISVIAIKVTFSFDINKFLKDRREIKLNQLKNVCPHLRMNLEGGNIAVESFFSSPIGTTQYVCSQCGLIVNSKEDAERLQEPFLKNPNLYIKQMERFDKLAKELNLY